MGIPHLPICGCSSVVERYPSKLDVAGSNPVSRFPITGILMSLISQQDRTLTIKALEHYVASFKDVMTESERAESNALHNWIKLEKIKHEH